MFNRSWSASAGGEANSIAFWLYTDQLLEIRDNAFHLFTKNLFILTEAFEILTTDCIATSDKFNTLEIKKLAWLKFSSSDICTGKSEAEILGQSSYLSFERK